uniref:Golgi apparatus protein 1 n=1 Tax=Elaeophora elaphi TaxID=1147741 RepID=A0A158Q8S0_9BILA
FRKIITERLFVCSSVFATNKTYPHLFQIHENQVDAQAPRQGLAPKQVQPQAPVQLQTAPQVLQQQLLVNPLDGKQQGLDTSRKHLTDYEECKEDIHKYCFRPGVELKSDMSVLECLQDVKLSETELLTAPCEHLVWNFKVNLTQDDQFRQASTLFCKDEMIANPALAKCAEATEPGHALSCFIDYILNLSRESRCFQFLDRSARLAFSDFRVVGPFVAVCKDTIQRLQCGTLTPPSAHAKVRVPHSQGHTLECLISKIYQAQQKDPKATPLVDEACQHEIMRIAELQTEDFHLDRPLYFACRGDREKFCKTVQSGQGKVLECLLTHRTDPMMEPECSKLLAERANMMGQNYRLSHPLLGGCAAEMKEFSCAPSALFSGSPNFHLSWVLLCLENAAHANPDKVSNKCQHEMLSHRKMMMSEFRLSPEVVLTCGREIDVFCSPKGDIEAEGRTLHCLLSHAQERNENQRLGPQCMQALQTVMKVADVGSNYKVDEVLYASCKRLIDGPCAMDAQSEANTLGCLMKHMDFDMPKECEQRLLEVQYFISRDWTLDPELYLACHEDAVSKCSANANWHQQLNQQGPDPGPMVLACLYRAAYNDQNPLKPECATNVRRALRTRAVRVNLMPDIEYACREALSEYCSTDVKPMQEMRCLQEYFQQDKFKKKYGECSSAISDYTKMMAKDTALNQALTKACRPVISKYCQQYINEEIDHGDVLECLLDNKGRPEMTSKCRSYVNHFELITLRDFKFDEHFAQYCSNDIKKYCMEVSTDKAEIIRCLSTIMFEHKVLGTPDDLEKDCKKYLKAAYLHQEQFDDKSHMLDADPTLMKKCSQELDRFGCRKEKYFEDVVECLRLKYDELGLECKAVIFTREKIEAVDNQFDDELQHHCRADINKYCQAEEGDRVLECLKNMKIIRSLSPKCQKIVWERMREQARDVRLNIGLLEACREEAEHYCPDDYKKINDPQYAKKTLEGVFIMCLRSQYADPQKSIHLNAKCKNEIANIILESDFDVRLDPQLYKACKNSISKHCSSDVIKHGGTFDSVLECLKTDFRLNVIQDADCTRQIARRLQESLVDIHLDPVLHEACANDIQRLCYDVPPGQIIICLLDSLKNENLKLSPTCRNKLTERNNLWNKAYRERQIALPESFDEMVNVVVSHPQRNSLLTWFGAFILILFLVGCCCGRATKRIKREMKNR